MIALIYRGFGLLAVCFLVVYYLFLEQPFLSYEDLPFKVEGKVFHPGDIVPMMVNRCSSSSTVRNYVLSHTLIRVDKPQEEMILPSTVIAIRPGCNSAVTMVNFVPKAWEDKPFPPGIYYMDGYAEVQATIRAVSVHWRSETFEVTQ